MAASQSVECEPQCVACREHRCGVSACGGEDAWCRHLCEHDFPRFIKRWEKRLFGYIRTITQHHQGAEDVLNKVWFRVWQHKHKVGWDERCVRPWLFTIAKNLALNWVRDNPPGPAPLPPAGGEAGNPVATGSVVIDECLAKLGTHERCMFECRYITHRASGRECDGHCRLSHANGLNALRLAEQKMKSCLTGGAA